MRNHVLVAVISMLSVANTYAADVPTTAPGGEGTGEYGAFAASKQWTPPTDPLVLDKLRKWQDQKVGLLIHWGPYSQWGIVESWSLVTTKHPWNKRPEKYANLDDKAYQQEYEKLPTTFNPVKFDADKWALAAKEAGIKYVLPMTKHHDGFCMWDTPTTDYKITGKMYPFSSDPRADTIKQITTACRKQGLSVGLYFSKADWHNPNYWLPEQSPGPGQGPTYDPTKQPEKWKQFKDFTWKQIEELMSNYGQIDILWLDGGAVRTGKTNIDMDGMAAMSRKHQPGLIVVDRTVHGPNENYVTPEGEIPDHYLPYPWETCMPLSSSWTYKPNDNYKSTGTMIRNLCRIVARGGNYLIGIGPDGTGEFDPMVYTRLKEIGTWLKQNGEAIYETRPIKPYEQDNIVFTTKSDGTIYAIILSKDDNTTKPPATFTIPTTLTTKAKTITLIGYGQLTDILIKDNNTTITIPEKAQEAPASTCAWVIKLSPK